MFETYRDNEKRWRWRLKADNGEIVAMATQSYRDRTDAERGVTDMVDAVHNANRESLTVYEGRNDVPPIPPGDPEPNEPLPEEA